MLIRLHIVNRQQAMQIPVFESGPMSQYCSKTVAIERQVLASRRSVEATIVVVFNAGRDLSCEQLKTTRLGGG